MSKKSTAVTIKLPPVLARFVSEVYESTGLSLKDYLDPLEKMIQKEILGTFDSPFAGIIDGLKAGEEMTDDELEPAWEVIERWRGKLGPED